ncbi:MAG: hypothetical protein Q9202_005217 [Teloschistes flavicans]
MPTARQKARRESASSTAASGSVKIRKPSMSNPSGTTSMRPRANTISHVDNATLGMLAAATSTAARHNGMNLNLGMAQHPPLGNLPGVSGYQFRGMSTAPGHHGLPHGLPKLDTNNFSLEVGASLRTAPPYAGLGGEMDMEGLWYGHANTINPAQLHFSNSPQSLSFDPSGSPYDPSFQGMSHGHLAIEDENTFSWMSGFDNQMSFAHPDEQAIDVSSPSAMSTGSHSGLSELMLDGTNQGIHAGQMWQPSMMAQTPMASAYHMEFQSPIYADYYQPGQSPKSMQRHMNTGDQLIASPPPMNPSTPLPFLHSLNGQPAQPSMVQAETPSNSDASVSSSNRQSSVTSISADSITDATRQALLASLSQPSALGHGYLKTSQPSISSPLSPAFVAKPLSSNGVPLPSTYDLQRYIAAYVKYFHPHLPFLHIPSLSFDSPDFTDVASNSSVGHGQSGIVGGAGSLVLAMAAIGAFYEYDTAASKDLFELAKKMIHLYLEERRKIETRRGDPPAAVNGAATSSESAAQLTPLWLVQAMLLNVIYGHNCGDKTAAGIATTHCAALVGLARAAELVRPPSDVSSQHATTQNPRNVSGDYAQMVDSHFQSEQWDQQQRYPSSDIYREWQSWKADEERKRTLYAVFILSSLLVSAYNHAPALMNSEIQLDLPCDEELWAAETAEAWAALKNSGAIGSNTVSFASALGSLLTASHRHPYRQSHMYDQAFGSCQNLENLPESDLRPSTLGCLVLINALHNYLWETRQRHMGRLWTTPDTKAMHAHIEPALRAWQAAWAGNPQHSLERPNPFGAGSLSADCIPLLDLAYVRLFVNFGRSKEAFFQRDWEGMANELAHGSEFIQHAESTTTRSDRELASQSSPVGHPSLDEGYPNIKAEPEETTYEVSLDQTPVSVPQPSERERYLRKAAYFAANALAMSDKLGVTFADFSSRELPIQSALCAFDCAQVLAEWCAAIQQRVGPYMGILGKDEADFSQVPGVMLVQEEDVELIGKMHDIIRSAEIKLADNSSVSATQALQSTHDLPTMGEYGYGSKVLLITAKMLEKAAVWPITHEMAQSLQTQAIAMNERAKTSIQMLQT